MNCLVLSVLVSFAQGQCNANNQKLEAVGVDPKDKTALVVKCSTTTFFMRGFIKEGSKYICLDK